MQDQTATELAARAVRMYAEQHPRPSSVTQAQAAEMLGVSRPTVRKLVAAGTLKLNALGQVPVWMIDAALDAA